MPETFSYEADIEPFASNLFDRIGASKDLSQETRNRLQGQVLTNVNEVQAQRLKLEEDRLSMDMKRLQYQEGVSALERARMQRQREESFASKLGDVQTQVRDVIASTDPYELKQQKLALLELDYAGNPDPGVQRIFGVARTAIPKPKTTEWTTQQRMDAGKFGVTPEQMATATPEALGSFIGKAESEVASKAEIRKREEEQAAAAASERKRIKAELLSEEVEYAKDVEGKPSGYIEPSSTAKVDAMVSAFGTPEDKRLFIESQSDPDDNRRVQLFYKIQARQLKQALTEATDPAAAKAATTRDKASGITGL